MYLDRRWLIYHAKSCFKIKVTSKEVLQYLFWYHFKICEPTTLPKNQELVRFDNYKRIGSKASLESSKFCGLRFSPDLSGPLRGPAKHVACEEKKDKVIFELVPDMAYLLHRFFGYD